MLHTLCSHLHTEVSDMPFKVSDSFIAENQVVAVLSGGTEAKFIDLIREKKVDLKRPIYLMVSEYSNSLPAALEILSFIRHCTFGPKLQSISRSSILSFQVTRSLQNQVLDHVPRLIWE